MNPVSLEELWLPPIGEPARVPVASVAEAAAAPAAADKSTAPVAPSDITLIAWENRTYKAVAAALQRGHDQVLGTNSTDLRSVLIAADDSAAS